MSDQMLSQGEIDAILASMVDGGGEGGSVSPDTRSINIKTYDFRNPRKFGTDHIRALSMIHENYARLLTTYFASRLRITIDVTLRSFTQFTFGEFMQNLDNPTVVAKFRLKPLPGVGLLEFSQNMALAITERVFGGGNIVGGSYPNRSLTDIEVKVADSILTGMLGILPEAWKRVADIEPTLQDGIETNPMFMQVAAPSDVLAALTFELTLGEQTGHFVLAIPFTTIEPVLPKLSQHHWIGYGDGQAADEEERTAIEASVLGSVVPITVELGKAKITVGQLTELKPGDVLAVDTFKTDPVPVYVGNRLTFHGEPGVSRGKVAVNIRRISLKKI